MIYERLASTVAAAHGTFTADLRSLMLGLRLAGALTPETEMGVRADTRRALTAFIASAGDAARTHLDDAFAGAPLSTRETHDKLRQLLQPLNRIGVDAILQLHAKVRGSGFAAVTGQGGALAQLAKRRDESFVPTAQDSAGRTWQADKLVRFLARDFGYQSFIDGRVALLLAAGESQGQVAWLDPNHERHGLLVALPLTPEIRAEIFHPNANAQLQRAAHVLA